MAGGSKALTPLHAQRGKQTQLSCGSSPLSQGVSNELSAFGVLILYSSLDMTMRGAAHPAEASHPAPG